MLPTADLNFKLNSFNVLFRVENEMHSIFRTKDNGALNKIKLCNTKVEGVWNEMQKNNKFMTLKIMIKKVFANGWN